MRDESLNPKLCEEEQEAERLEAMLLEARVVRALERVPEPVRADLCRGFCGSGGGAGSGAAGGCGDADQVWATGGDWSRWA